MKKTLSILGAAAAVMLTVIGAAPAQAAPAESEGPASWSTEYYRMTPTERLRINTEKADQHPFLRGRWNRMSQTPASDGAYLTDNLSQRVLDLFREDEELSQLPARIKVRSSGGNVTLEGEVAEASQKTLITSKVRALSGVKGLENRIQVRSVERTFEG